MALTARVRLPVTVHVDGAGDVPASVQLYGPGDVTGLDPARSCAATRRAGTTRFEAGYMPQVQLARADLPWLFTPAAPGDRRRRGCGRGWCSCVRRRTRGAEARRAAARARARRAGEPAAELPDLSQSWAWAHGQITGLPTGARPADCCCPTRAAACSRLLCPRHLEPDTAYLACVVPAFRPG